jgi:hypothetical protein
MSDEPTTGCHADAVRILTGMMTMLDSANSNDRAFKQASIVCVFNLLYYLQNSIFHSPKLTLSCLDMMQCIVYNTPFPVAIECLGSTLSRQGMYKRIARWRSSLAPANLAIVQSIEVARGIMLRCSAPAESTRVNSKGVTITAATAKSVGRFPFMVGPRQIIRGHDASQKKDSLPSQLG